MSKLSELVRGRACVQRFVDTQERRLERMHVLYDGDPDMSELIVEVESTIAERKDALAKFDVAIQGLNRPQREQS